MSSALSEPEISKLPNESHPMKGKLYGGRTTMDCVSNGASGGQQQTKDPQLDGIQIIKTRLGAKRQSADASVGMFRPSHPRVSFAGTGRSMTNSTLISRDSEDELSSKLPSPTTGHFSSLPSKQFIMKSMSQLKIFAKKEKGTALQKKASTRKERKATKTRKFNNSL